jgi:hypothetical protein
LTLTGCAELPTDAPISKVDYKACVVEEKGQLPSPLLDVVDYAVKQAVVTYGITKTTVATVPEQFEKTIAKQAKQKCDLMLISGFGFSELIEPAVKNNPSINFIYVSDRSNASLVRSNQENLVVYSVDTYEAGYLAGFLSAGLSENARVLTGVCPVVGMNDLFSKGLIAGVSNYSLVSGVAVEEVMMFDMLPPNGPMQPDVYATAGCPSEDDVSTLNQTEMKLVGYGRDRFGEAAFEQIKNRIAATVQPQLGTRILDVIGSDLESDFIGGTLGSFTATYGNGGLELSPEHDVNLPPALLERLKTAAADYEASLK